MAPPDLEVNVPTIPRQALLALAMAASPVHAQETGFVWQGLPERVVAGVERRDRFFATRLPHRGGDGDEFVFERDKTWGPGATVTVAFNGGDRVLRDKIATAAQSWAQHAKVTLDFKKNGAYRTWSPQDRAYASQIRIGFADRGYWSAVGTDSADPLVMGPGEPSMNFTRFAVSLPRDWRATVIHEFGHALGFHHEHQNPNGGCQDQFRFEDDAGYIPTRDVFGQFVPDRQGRKPGLYTELGGPPNNWSKQMVDFNLGKLSDEHPYITSTFDPASIMKYFFDAGMFKDGDRSRCFSSRNVDLSQLDKAGAVAAYPADAAAVESLRRTREAALSALLAVPDLSSEQRAYYEGLRANFRAR